MPSLPTIRIPTPWLRAGRQLTRRAARLRLRGMELLTRGLLSLLALTLAAVGLWCLFQSLALTAAVIGKTGAKGLMALFASFAVAPVLLGVGGVLSLPFFRGAARCLELAQDRELGALPGSAGEVPILEYSLRVVTIRRRRAIAVSVEFETALLDAGERLELTTRIRDAGKRWLDARLPAWRQPDGSFLARERSQPITADDTLSLTVVNVFPVRAVDFPRISRFMHFEALVELHRGGQRVASRVLPFDFMALDADYAEEALPAVPALSAGELEVVSQDLDAGEACCGVCGDPLMVGLVTCSFCATPHHQECWTYLGRCSVYACDGQAAEMATRKPT